MKLIVNHKYVPHSKTAGGIYNNLEYSTVWTNAKKQDQPYLYYTGRHDGYHCFDSKPWTQGNSPSGDFFSPTDVTEYIEEPNKTNNMSFEGLDTGIKFNVQPGVQCQLVENEFILAAYKAACSDWKYKIETKFPDLFKTSAIEKAIEKVGSKCYGSPVTHEGIYVKVPLPNANTDWTLAAFDYVKKFIAAYPQSYPAHYSGVKNGVNFDTSEYIYIDFSSYLL